MATFRRLDRPVGIRFGTQQVANEVTDQQAVGTVLDNIPVQRGGNRNTDDSLATWWPLPIKGKCSKELYRAILKFQTVNGAEVGGYKDGVCDPNGPTYRHMLALAIADVPLVTVSPKTKALEVLPLAKRWVNNAKMHLRRLSDVDSLASTV